MRRLLAMSGVALTALLTTASGAEAQHATRCNRTIARHTIKADLVVRAGEACRLNRVTVRGDVDVRAGGFLQATRATVRGNVQGSRAETLFFEDHSRVTGSVVGDRTGQVFVFGSTIGGRIDVSRAAGKVNVCGNTVQGDIEIVDRSGPDILVGDPLAIDCPGNVVKQGDIIVKDSFTYVELVVRGNTLVRGDLTLSRNGGPSAKFVQDNEGGNDLVCSNNTVPFTALDNTGWGRLLGQCG